MLLRSHLTLDAYTILQKSKTQSRQARSVFQTRGCSTQPHSDILTDVVLLTVSPSMQTVNGKIRMYHPAQNPATGKAMKMRIKNQMICHKTLPPAAMIIINSKNPYLSWKLLKLSDNRRKTTPSSVSDWRTAKP